MESPLLLRLRIKGYCCESGHSSKEGLLEMMLGTFLSGNFQGIFFPSGNFQTVRFPKRKLPKSVLNAAGLTFGKLPLGKLSLGRSPLGKCLWENT